MITLYKNRHPIGPKCVGIRAPRASLVHAGHPSIPIGEYAGSRDNPGSRMRRTPVSLCTRELIEIISLQVPQCLGIMRRSSYDKMPGGVMRSRPMAILIVD
ncbi:hypothetical protein GDO81_010887 [Engystomops pustulosus]|uniref:Uncharacterized protein n=1 Tax=Engystomops pustulosus TaxID=76066 RepID=A0AAV7C393_ENGPU|nr:hypothetical protein GDO81_010887 [Engystomops pustulosus]